jgi:hypothetical protein
VAYNYSDFERSLWTKGKLRYKLWEQQLAIYDAYRSLPPTASEAVFLCARQFGKSYLGCVLALEDCLRFPDTCTLVIGPDIKQTVGIVAPRLRDICKDAPAGLVVQQKSESKWTVGSSELVIGGMDISSASQRGKTLQNVYVEEIVDSNPDKYMDSLRGDIGPALTHSKGGRITFLTTLPRMPDHPFLLDTVPAAMLNGAYYKYTIYDNRQINQEQFDRCVKLAGGIDSVDFRREYLCEVVRDGSLVLVPEFSEERHVMPCAVPEHAKFWIAGDTGGTRDRHVFHLCCYDFLRNKTLVIDERAFPSETSTGQIVPELREMEKDYHISSRHVDCPGQLQIDLMLHYSYPTSLPRKDELDATVNQVRKAAQCNEFEIDPKCRFLITTLRSGTYNATRSDLMRTRSLGHCDAFMSFAYGLRHKNVSNPYPPIYRKEPHKFYVDREVPQMSKSAQVLKSMFTLRR